MNRPRRSKLGVSWWMFGATLLSSVVPLACGDDDDPSTPGSGSSAGVGGKDGTTASGGSSSGAPGDAGQGGETPAAGGSAGATGGGETGGEGGAIGGQGGLGGDGGDGEAGQGAGGMPELVNIVGDGWDRSQRTWAPDKLFDGGGWPWSPISPTGWAQYEFLVKPASIQSYGLVSGSDTPEQDPRSWVLLGNDTGPDADEASDSEWTILDSRSDQGPFAERNTLYTFDVSTPGSFKFYRLKVTANNGDARLKIAELELYATPGVNAIDGVRATGFPLYAEGPNRLYDRDPETKFYTTFADTWVQYELRAATAPVEAYAIVTANDVPERDPRSWKLLANDTGPDANDASDSEWTVLDTQTDQGPFPERKQRYTYPIENPGTYKFYRLKVESSNGAPALQFSEFELLAR